MRHRERARQEASSPDTGHAAAAAVASPPSADRGFRPTEEQEAIAAAARDLRPGTVLRVVAYAGAGKTSTLRLVARRAGRGAGIYVAFNSDTAKGAGRSFGRSVTARTMHSVAWRAFGLRGDQVEALNGHKAMALLGAGGWLMRQECELTELGQARLVARAVALFCQSSDPSPGPETVERVLDDLVYRRPAEPPADGLEAADHSWQMRRRDAIGRMLLRRAPALWERVSDWRRTGGKTSHDVYLKAFERDPGLIRGALGGFGYMMLDEAQDLNPVMRSIVVQSGLPIVAVGDPRQQIYGWNGAENALARLPGRVLYLSQSFRFGEAIAAAAWRVMEAAPAGAPRVRLRGCGPRGSVSAGTTGPVVLSRTNVGNMEAAFDAVREGKRVHVVGGIEDLAVELEGAVALSEGRLGDVLHEALRRFRSWQEYRDEAEQMGSPHMLRIVEAVEDGEILKTVAAVRAAASAAEDGADVVLSTAHKAKGKEWPAVALSHDWPDLDRMNRRLEAARHRGHPDQIKAAADEWNVLYVAVTRASERLVLPPHLYDWLGPGAEAPPRAGVPGGTARRP